MERSLLASPELIQVSPSLLFESCRIPHPSTPSTPRLWMPQRVLFSPEALRESWGERILERVQKLGLPIEELPSNRLTNLRGATERETYKRAKNTLAVVCAPPSQLKLQPIPPSADYQFHLAQGCPAHCQYCYLAGSLSGPPVVRAYANLPEILDNLKHYEKPDQFTTFEASCYTDVLALEHLTGSLAQTIRYFGMRANAGLRWVSKFDAVDSLLDLPHNNRTRARFSLNAAPIASRLEGRVSSLSKRLQALRRMALPTYQGGGNYPIGIVLAPIMPIENWHNRYTQILDDAQAALDFDCDLTWELITHRFTPGSKNVLLSWYRATSLEMEEGNRVEKRNKFGGVKYVYPKEQMKEMRPWFEREIEARFPASKILYWT